MDSYDFKTIEQKWQKKWDEEKTFAWNPDKPGEKMYSLVMFPYPSGALHMGHILNYTLSDSIVRYNLSRGKNVFSPIGWDAFGLPAENAAIKAGTPPKKFTTDNIDKMRTQMKRAGWAYDWSTEVATCHPGYYKWTQWLFLQFFKRGLAYKKMSAVNWCPRDMTVLANEQVQDDKCERCGATVEKKDLNQWFFKMSAFAQRLLDGHKTLESQWPEKVIKMQKEWIGRSEGARLDFRLESTNDIVSVFTTRPDTVYGVTFMSLAPEHPIIEKLLVNNPREKEIRQAIHKMRCQSNIERTSESSEKEGIFTGHYLINPFNGHRVELWIANYALMEYGTGAVMAVPAHDQRDFLFAKKYNLKIDIVIQPKDQTLDPATMTKAYDEDGYLVNSAQFDGKQNRQAMHDIVSYAKEQGFGDFTVHYRLKDWLLSRQRYWGTPIPIINCEDCGLVPVPEDQLPVLLPENVEFLPTGASPLQRCESWINVPCPKCGKMAKRETDTIDTFIDSSWYFLRYTSARDEEHAFNPERVKQLLPVDLYIGGSEHANMHLIYARFFTMVLHDLGYLDFTEPFPHLFCQGLICKTAHYCPEHSWTPDSEIDFVCPNCQSVSPAYIDLKSENVEVVDASGRKRTEKVNRLYCKLCQSEIKAYHKNCGQEIRSEMAKMSKTKKNGVSPDQLFEKYGADTLRVGILRLGPVDQELVYSESVMTGEFKFLQRIFNTVNDHIEELKNVTRFSGNASSLTKEEKDLRRRVHSTLQDTERAFQKDFSFNTLLARLHELLRDIIRAEKISAPVLREAIDVLLFSLAPFAPHLTEELWQALGNEQTILHSEWPTFDSHALQLDEVTIVVQVNSKIKDRMSISVDLSEDEIKEKALALDRVKSFIGDKPIKKVLVVPNKLINLIV